MTGVKICFSSDIHGNCSHLRQILATSVDYECDVVILGGDLAPRGSGMGVEGNRLHLFLPYKENGKPDWDSDGAYAYMDEAYHRQGRWFEETFIPMLAAHPIPTVCLFGNSDWRGLWPRCDRAARQASERVGVPRRVRFVAGEGDLFTLETLARQQRKRQSDGGDNDNGGAPVPVATVDALSCSLVPLCAHKKKDWERCDTRDLRDTTCRAPHMEPSGFASDEKKGVVRRVVPVTEEAAQNESIEAALERIVSRYQKGLEENGEKKEIDIHDRCARGAGSGAKKRKADAVQDQEKDREEEEEDAKAVSSSSSAAAQKVPPVWIIHAPPQDTVADLTNGGDHVGSLAVRRAIERHRPRFSMHGHIHESSRLHGGRFTQTLRGKDDDGSGGDGGGDRNSGPLVITVGNDFREANPHCVIVNSDRPEDAVRVECAPLSAD